MVKTESAKPGESAESAPKKKEERKPNERRNDKNKQQNRPQQRQRPPQFLVSGESKFFATNSTRKVTSNAMDNAFLLSRQMEGYASRSVLYGTH